MAKTVDISINKPVVRYTIDIGEDNLLNLPNLLKSKLLLKQALPKILLVTHQNLNSLYGQKLSRALTEAGFSVATECINSGESIKTWISAEKLLLKMIDLEMDRTSIVIALGGGVVGDLAGFVASVYHRGIRFVQVPTSLLAMVDSSVGGKVAVNLGLVGKNLIGSFHQPSLVLTDLALLKSLPEAEWKNGLSEIIKCAFIKEDKGVFAGWLLANQEAILSKTNMQVLEQMIYEAVKAKANVVSKDELEKSGVRALLNLGHTFGHSLEAASRYRLAHGEAISIGISLAARLSLKLKKITPDVFGQIMNTLKAFGLSSHIDKKHGFTSTELIRHFKFDKKNEGQIISFILPVGFLGHCEITQNVPEDLLQEVFAEATF